MLKTQMHTLHEALCRKFKKRQSPSPETDVCITQSQGRAQD